MVGFEHRRDARRFVADLRGRFANFGLGLHAEKTRLIEFGRFAADRRRMGLKGKPETFEFLGFTHICAEARDGRFKLARITSKKRMRAKLREVKTELRRRRHVPIPEQGRWLAALLPRLELHRVPIPRPLPASPVEEAFRFGDFDGMRLASRRASAADAKSRCCPLRLSVGHRGRASGPGGERRRRRVGQRAGSRAC